MRRELLWKCRRRVRSSSGARRGEGRVPVRVVECSGGLQLASLPEGPEASRPEVPPHAGLAQGPVDELRDGARHRGGGEDGRQVHEAEDEHPGLVRQAIEHA